MLERIGDIVVFGLAEREDRWQRCKQILEENKITKVTRFANEKGADLYRNQTEDFLRVLRLKGHNNIVFFEDDFELTKGWESVLTDAWKDLPSDWDLLYLGANLTRSPQKITNNLVKIRGAWCFHAVVISPKFVKYALANYDINRRVVWDEWIRTEAVKRKFYMTYPMISYQRASYSDFVKKEVDYDIFNNRYYKKI